MNSTRGEVELELNGENLVMVFRYETLMAIEDAFGSLSIDELFLSGNISRNALAEAVRCGLEKRYRKKNRKQVAAMIGKAMEEDEEAYGRICRAVIIGILAANGASKEKIDEFIKTVDAADEDSMQPRTDTEKQRDDEGPTAQPVALTSTG